MVFYDVYRKYIFWYVNLWDSNKCINSQIFFAIIRNYLNIYVCVSIPCSIKPDLCQFQKRILKNEI